MHIPYHVRGRLFNNGMRVYVGEGGGKGFSYYRNYDYIFVN